MKFIKLHCKGVADLFNMDMVYRFTPATKGAGTWVIDGGGDSILVDESREEIEEMLIEIEVEIIEGAND